MIPSSSSPLARYGHISHYKKFWLLQTQLEKQEQSSSASSTLSLGSGASAPGPRPGPVIKDSSKPSSLVAHHVNGDGHHYALVTPQHGICRVDMAASSSSNCGGKVINVGPALAYCPSEPACVSSYFMKLAGHGLHPTITALRVDSDGPPRLSLAVNCEDASDGLKWKSDSSSLQARHSNLQQQTLERLGAEEPELSESFREEEKSCNGSSPGTSSASLDHLIRMDEQGHVVSGFQCRNLPVPLNITSVSGPPPPSGYPRICTLCGTTRTPLWRSGPDGPKSLCNACGIRVKKTKRLEAALQATSETSPSPSTKSAFKGALKRKLSTETQKDPNFHKKKRSNIFISPKKAKEEFLGHNKKPGGLWDNATPKLADLLSENGRGRANIFAEDVEEAAVLLMALSCGLVLS